MGFDFTVALAPSGPSIDRELQYVKSALLYADKVTLISPMAYLYTQLANDSSKMDMKEMVRLLDYVLPICQNSDPVLYESMVGPINQIRPWLTSKNKLRSMPKLTQISLRKGLLDFCKTMDTAVVRVVGESQAQELQQLLASGKLHLQKFEHSVSDVDGCIPEYLGMLTQSIKTSYPLFDKQSNDVMSAAVRARIVNLSDADQRKIRHAGMSDNFIQRLPSFEMASVDEILDIRKELDPSLARFRSKMISYSDSIQALPWDNDFETESSLLYYQEVAPAITEIREMAQDNSFLKNLGGKVLADTDFMTNAGQLAVSVAAAGVISSLADAASLDAAVLTAGGVWAVQKVKSAYDEYAEKKKEIQRKDLYFYYQAGEQLRKLH